jgi:hypothetical protein
MLAERFPRLRQTYVCCHAKTKQELQGHDAMLVMAAREVKPKTARFAVESIRRTHSTDTFNTPHIRYTVSHAGAIAPPLSSA